jgi:hypothetical protein
VGWYGVSRALRFGALDRLSGDEKAVIKREGTRLSCTPYGKKNQPNQKSRQESAFLHIIIQVFGLDCSAVWAVSDDPH